MDNLLTFKESNHRYYYDGKPVPGVTTILGATIPKPQLIPWAVRMACEYLTKLIELGQTIDINHIEEARREHTRKKDEAADVGTLAHAWVENHIKGVDQEMPEDPRVLNGVNAFLKWEEERKPKYLHSELRLYSKKWKVAGTADIVAIVGDKIVLIDVKSGNGIYAEAYIQTSAYRAMLEEIDIKAESIEIIRISKEDGEFQNILIEPDRIKLYEKRFDLCVKSYYLDKKLHE